MKKVMANVFVGCVCCGFYFAGMALGQYSGKAEGKMLGRKEACAEVIEKLSEKYIQFDKEGKYDGYSWVKAALETVEEVLGLEVEPDTPEEA
jgi:hypothetical protein